MKKYSEILSACPMFAGIPPESLGEMLACLGARRAEYGRRQPILREGERADRIGIVLEGGVQITRVDYMGNRSMVGHAEAGDIFGEAFACAGVAELPVDVTAAEPSVLLLLDSARLLHPCESACAMHRTVIFNLMRILAAKNLSFHQKLEITSKRTTREKLLAYLDLQSKRRGSREFDIPFDRQELADYLVVDRSGLSAEISRLTREGVLTTHRKHFKLLP